MPQGRNYEGGSAGVPPLTSTTECTQDGQGGPGPQVSQVRTRQDKHPRATAVKPTVNFVKNTKGGWRPQRRAWDVVACRGTRVTAALRNPESTLQRRAKRPRKPPTRSLGPKILRFSTPPHVLRDPFLSCARAFARLSTALVVSTPAGALMQVPCPLTSPAQGDATLWRCTLLGLTPRLAVWLCGWVPREIRNLLRL